MLYPDECKAWFTQQWLYGHRQTKIAAEFGVTASAINENICRFIEATIETNPVGRYGTERKKLAARALLVWMAQGNPVCVDVSLLVPKPQVIIDEELRLEAMYNHARHEHVFLLRCEGLKFKEIAPRLGVTSGRVNQMFHKFVERMKKATRRTHWTIVEG